MRCVSFDQAVVFVSLLLLLVLGHSTATTTTTTTTTSVRRRVAVLEHNVLARPPPVTWSEAQAVKQSNLDVYASAMSSANASVIVFPEQGLNGFLYNTRDECLPYCEPYPLSDDVPCTSSDPIYRDSPTLVTLSCLALKHRQTVVADIAEVVWCNATRSTTTSAHENDDECPEDGRWQFNTQVAVSADGVLVGRYRKQNLFPEDLLTFDYPPEKPEVVVFESEFGRACMLVCFDMFFASPLRECRSQGISAVTFSTWWVNNGTHFPPITATQIQQAVSRTFEIETLIASNVGIPVHDSGSGIYSFGNPIATYFDDNPNDKRHDTLLVADIELSNYSPPPQWLAGDSSSSARDDGGASSVRSLNASYVSSLPRQSTSSTQYAAADIVPFEATVGQSVSLTAHSGTVSCVLDADIVGRTSFEAETFALVAYDGLLFSDLLHGRVCAVVKCEDASPESCTELSLPTGFRSSTFFENFSLSFDATEPGCDLSLNPLLPVVGTDEAQLLPPSTSDFSQSLARDSTSGSIEIVSSNILLNVVLFQQGCLV